jgi:transposase
MTLTIKRKKREKKRKKRVILFGYFDDNQYLYTMKVREENGLEQVTISPEEYRELLSLKTGFQSLIVDYQSLKSEHQSLKSDHQSLKSDHQSLKSDYQYVCFQLSELQRLLFGSKSERFKSSVPDAIQGDLFASQGLEVPQIETPVVEREVITYERSKEKQQPSRSPLPEHLHREEEVIEPENIPEGAVKIGEAVTEILEYKPAEVYVRRIVRPKYVVPGTEGEGCVVIAPMPSIPIVKGNAGASLLSHICVSKFADHLPFYRQARMFKRDKIPVCESTLKGWFSAACRLLEPLYEKLREEIKKESYLQVDESPLPVLTSEKPGATHKGYMWVFNAPVSGLACFYYDKSRSGEVVDIFLGDYQGALQTDAYSGYDRYKNRESVTLLGCAAHCRRKFEHAKESDPKRSRQALVLFRCLYQVEEQAREAAMSEEERLDLRGKHSIEIMAEIKALLESWRMEVLPKSPIGIATAYTLNVWERLEKIMTDGKYEIDNNLIENRIRPLALGRKNYLFAGSHQSAQCNAMMYSFFACCKNADLNPSQWLTDVLNRIPDHKAAKLTELLPNNWTKINK